MTLGHLIEKASTAKPSWRVVLHRCLDTALTAAAGIGALDWMASRSFCPRTAGLGQLFLVLLGLAPLMARSSPAYISSGP